MVAIASGCESGKAGKGMKLTLSLDELVTMFSLPDSFMSEEKSDKLATEVERGWLFMLRRIAVMRETKGQEQS